MLLGIPSLSIWPGGTSLRTYGLGISQLILQNNYTESNVNFKILMHVCGTWGLNINREFSLSTDKQLLVIKWSKGRRKSCIRVFMTTRFPYSPASFVTADNLTNYRSFITRYRYSARVPTQLIIKATGKCKQHNQGSCRSSRRFLRFWSRRSWRSLQELAYQPNYFDTSFDMFKLHALQCSPHVFKYSQDAEYMQSIYSTTGKPTILPEHLDMAEHCNPSAVAVYCASSLGKQNAFQWAALSLGRALAEAKRPLVYGGGNYGLMGVVSGAVMDEGGKVIGVIPYAIHASGGEIEKVKAVTRIEPVAEVLDKKGRGQTETIIVDSMHERKTEMAKRVGAFVGLPGGYGTFEEILEVVTWNQLNIHNKPVILLNVLSYYNPLRELIRNGVREGFILPLNEKICVFVDGPADQKDHESFDWGKAAVDAIAAWQHVQVQTYPFHWTKGIDTSSMTISKASIKEMNGMNGALA